MVKRATSPPPPDLPALPALPNIGKRDETNPSTAMHDVNPNLGMLQNLPLPRANVPQPMEHPPIVRPYARAMDMEAPVRELANSMGANIPYKQSTDDTAVRMPTAANSVLTNRDNVLHGNEQQRPDGSKVSDFTVAGTSSNSDGQTLHTNDQKSQDGKETSSEDVGGNMITMDESDRRRSDDEVISMPNATIHRHTENQNGRRAH
ncbi:hypothetical protein B0H19DRAFT_1106039 [Mycena capillaripes]|nr:hypothetical protein B0H19DRAFT_1106039 [Mycena capillaripes]